MVRQPNKTLKEAKVEVSRRLVGFWRLSQYLVGFFLLLVSVTHTQAQIPLEEYVGEYFRQKAIRQQMAERMPKPTPTPLSAIPPYPNIFAPYNPPSLLKSIPKRDHEPLYIRPGLIPPLPDPTPLPHKSVPAPKPSPLPKPSPTPKTLYVFK
jgi:hypothetical protein